jgi:hypothetical protein
MLEALRRQTGFRPHGEREEPAQQPAE